MLLKPVQLLGFLLIVNFGQFKERFSKEPSNEDDGYSMKWPTESEHFEKRDKREMTTEEVITMATTGLSRFLSVFRGEVDPKRVSVFRWPYFKKFKDNYIENVLKPIQSIIERFENVTSNDYNFKESELNTVTDSLCSGNHSAFTIASAYLSMVENCQNVSIDADILANLLTYFHKKFPNGFTSSYSNIYLDGVNKLFGSDVLPRFIELYYYFIDVGFNESTRLLNQYNSDYANINHWDLNGLISHMIEKLAVPENVSQSHCFLEVVFIYFRFRRQEVSEIQSLLAHNTRPLVTHAELCSRLRSIVKNETEEAYQQEFVAFIKPVTHTILKYVPKLLNSTWPKLEKVMLKSYLDTLGSEYNDTFDPSHMFIFHSNMGHPDFQKIYLLSPYAENEDYYFDCKPNHCQLVQQKTTYNVFVLRFNSSEKEENKEKLDHYFYFLSRDLGMEMEYKYSKEKNVTSVVHRLAAEDGLNLSDFKNHNGFVVLRKEAFFASKCGIDHGMEQTPKIEKDGHPREDNDIVHKKFQYYNNDSLFKNCINWLFIFF